MMAKGVQTTGIQRRRDFELPSFRLEEDFRQAIAGLLRRIPGVSDVQITHGAQELGKDIVFQGSGPLRERVRCACVVKTKKITGKVAEKKSARSIVDQIEQALDSPYTDGNGCEVRIERVYVISAEEISQTAMQSVAGKLYQRVGQIIFLGGGQLVGLFMDFWEEFFSDEYHTLIERHLNRTTQIAAEPSIKKIVATHGLGEISTAEATIYVSRTFSRTLKLFSVKDVYHIVDTTWAHEWRRQNVEIFKKNITLLNKLIVHLGDWGFWGKGRNSLRIALHSFSKKVEGRWLLLAKQKDLDQATSAVVVIFPEEEQESLQREFDKLLDAANEQLNLLRHACSEVRHGTFDSHDISVLSSANWKIASALNDCAKHAPIDVFNPVGEISLEFGEREMLKHSGVLLITGAAGYGKTSFCRWHSLEDVELLSLGKGSLLPVYVPLNSLPEPLPNDFEAAFLLTAGESVLIPARDKYAGIRLYLDGLDEVTSSSQRKKIIDLVKEGLKTKEFEVQVFITARDYVIDRDLSDIPRIELGSLRETEVDDLISKWFRHSQSVQAEFEEQLAAAPSLKGLMQVPLLATLIVLVFRQTGTLPENRARLYAIFVELLSGGWDLAKGTLRHPDFGSVVKIAVLEALAASMHAKRLRYFSAWDILGVAESSFRSKVLNYPRLLEELIADGIIARSGAVYYFSHLSFQEFLTAREFLGDPRSRGAERAIREYFAGHGWWSEVIRFYIGLSGSPAKIANWIASAAPAQKKDAATTALRWIREFFPEFDVEGFIHDNLD